jgi:hypothetical protein
MMYWVYDISNFNFALFMLGSFVVFGVVGLLITQWILGRRKERISEENDIVSFYFSAVVAFYGITLGLISVGVWQTFSESDTKSTTEAAALESLYRDVSSYPEPTRSACRPLLIKYTENVINVAWPMQQLGQIPTGGSEIMTEIQMCIFPFEPQTQGQMAIHQEALGQYNRVSELRRLRVLSATSGLPAATWWVLVAGAAVSIALTWLFVVESRARHVLLTGIYSGLIGLPIAVKSASARRPLSWY